MENGELFHGYRVAVLQDENSSGDWLHSSVNELAIEMYTLKWIGL